MVAKAEVTDKGRNPRFVVTTLPSYDARRCSEEYYMRDEMEIRIDVHGFMKNAG